MDLARYKVWLNGDVAYYPVRKSGSTSLQHAFGGEPVDMRLVPMKGIRSFTMVRNPFDRLASLYANHLDYYPLQQSGIEKGMSFEEFISKVCDTREPLCDHHLWGADHTTPHEAEVFWFEDFGNELLRLRRFLGRPFPVRHFYSNKAPKPEYTTTLESQVAQRYDKDLKRFYENNRTQQDCRARGKTEAELRRKATPRTS